jgi:Ser/Thr protein kinase RdoA (MazF antagonist)
MFVMDSFIKFHGRDLARDWQRMNHFYQLSKSGDYFIFPRPESCQKESIVYQRLNNIERMPECIDAENAEEIMKKTGRALAFVHNSKKSAEKVVLHSDFGMINVSWCDTRRLPVFFDPVPARFCPFKDGVGDRYFDIAEFIVSIFSLIIFAKLVRKSWRLPRLMVKAFVEGYEVEAGLKLDRLRLLKSARRLHQNYYSYRIKATSDFRYFLMIPLILFIKFLMLQVLRCR